MKININIFLLLLLTAFISCDEDGYADFNAGETNTQPFHGEWYVVAYGPDGEPAFGGDYNLFSTYNTAANNDSIWLDDHGTLMELKTRVNTNLQNLTFMGAQDAPELISGGTVTVSNGKIIIGGGRAASSRTQVDSIYFEAEFDWDPGVIYSFGGHERTGYDEDDNPHIN